jgi:TPR repeat protein
MKDSYPIIRAVLMCATLSAALMSVNACTDQVNPPPAKAISVDPAALKALISKAQQGNPDAQFSLGSIYFAGQGVPQDYSQAAQWYRKAAEQGYAYAQSNLGFLYENGYGVPQDYGQAVQWYRKAAEQGFANAQNNLGNLYAYGHGVPQDYGQAVQWYRKAAQQGQALALHGLGLLYARGQGVPQNKIVAYALSDRAVVLNAPSDAHAPATRAALAANMTEQEIKSGQALSQEMSRPGNLLNALDQYLAASTDKGH